MSDNNIISEKVDGQFTAYSATTGLCNIITEELIGKLYDVAKQLSQAGPEFSMDFEFGSVKFVFTEKCPDYEAE